MKRMLLGAAVVGALAFAAQGCSSDDDAYGHGRYDNGGYGSTSTCGGYTTCDTCTPVAGCGWCQYDDGTGACAAGPSACGDHTFRWNWDPPQCPASATTDSGTTSDAPASDAADAAKDASDASSSETATDASSDATETSTVVDSSPTNIDAPPPPDTGVSCRPPDPGTTDCAPTSGGSLCGEQATFSCHSPAAPAAPLHCTLALTMSSASYYCCPCAP